VQIAKVGGMNLFALVTLAMAAFAANSVLNRAAVFGAGMDPMVFACIRVAAGAVMLGGLVRLRHGHLPLRGGRRIAGAVALALYMLGFSWAYTSLGAGLGALILFGVVQLVMFSWSILQRQPLSAWRAIGASIAFGGLILLLWPAGAVRVPVAGALSMAAAGVGWGAYSLLGRAESDPLAATAANFLLCLPLVFAGLFFQEPASSITLAGTLLACVSGAVTSGLGYALWYRVLPQLAATLAGIVQLSVPVIAVAAGVVLLGEHLTLRMVIAGLMVLGGIAVSVLLATPGRHRRIGSSGS
jgi:drug/metabolite transporter (DMT)-like permease